jgi:two-component system invasion response regulator UvrY
MTLRVLLVDDHAIVREGYRALLEKQADLRVVGEAANGEEAYLACLTDAPDVVVMDLTMPARPALPPSRGCAAGIRSCASSS